MLTDNVLGFVSDVQEGITIEQIAALMKTNEERFEQQGRRLKRYDEGLLQQDLLLKQYEQRLGQHELEIKHLKYEKENADGKSEYVRPIIIYI